MPSILGIVTRSNATRISAALTRMVEQVPISDRQVSDQQVSTQAGLSITRRTQQGGIARRGDLWLAFTGQIVEDRDYQSRMAYLGVDRPIGFCQRLLSLYIRMGERGLHALNGQYTIAVWDNARQRLLLINDRYGLQPLYYWRGPHELVFGSHLKALAAYPGFARQVNPVALVDLLATGQMVGEHTLFAGVQALPPAARLTFEAGRLTLDTYTRLPFYQPGRPVPTLEEAVEGLDEHLQAAVTRRAEQTTNLLVSGGLDSRLLAGYLGELNTGWQHSASTIGRPESLETALASAVAAEAHLTHHIVPANTAFLQDYTPLCVARTEGGLNVHASWIFGAEEDLQTNPVQAVMTGAGGEGIMGRHLLGDQAFSSAQQALNWQHSHHWQYPQAASLLRSELRTAVAESQARLESSLPDGPDELFASRLDEFHYRLARRRPSASLLDTVVSVQEPYFDIDLVDYALCLPPEMRAGGRLLKSLLAVRFPQMATLASINSQPRPPAWQRLLHRTRRTLGRTFFFLNSGPLGDDTTRAIFYNHWLRSACRPFVTNLLTRADLLGDYFDMRAVRSLLDAHMTGRRNAYRPLCALVTFAEWRKQFM